MQPTTRRVRRPTKTNPHRVSAGVVDAGVGVKLQMQMTTPTPTMLSPVIRTTNPTIDLPTVTLQMVSHRSPMSRTETLTGTLTGTLTVLPPSGGVDVVVAPER